MNTTDLLRTLQSSTMFHMSLGSKELFHSNFLHWISIVEWKAFLYIMHGLADVEKFWWEDEYCPDKNNLEVRRESQNFDLSIYILIEEKEEKQKWIPVLVLENKVKSIPYKKQLERYEEKAKKDWRKKDWNNHGNRVISFILLSLLKDLPEDILPVEQTNSSGPKCIWTNKSYNDLSVLLSENAVVSSFENLNKEVLIDYTQFISSLDKLANDDWKIKDSDCWEVIYPWKQKQRKYTDDPYVKLRIHDLWEKIHYEQLLKFLMDKLKKENVRITQDRDEYKNQKDKIVLCSSGYAHNIGLFEAWVKNGIEDYIIQVQGDSYHRGYVCAEGTHLEELKDSYFLRKMEEFEFSYKEGKDGKKSLYSFKDSNRTKVFYYSKAVIDDKTLIETIIDAMCEDIKSLLGIGHT